MGSEMCIRDSDIPAHTQLLSPDGVNLLPYLLLPLMGNEEYTDEDTDGMLDEVQLLDPDKKREPEDDIIITHLETLLLLTSSPEGRARLREVKLYPIVRELHMKSQSEDVQDACDRLVQVLMRGEEGEEREDEKKMKEIGEKADEEDEEEQMVEVA